MWSWGSFAPPRRCPKTMNFKMAKIWVYHNSFQAISRFWPPSCPPLVRKGIKGAVLPVLLQLEEGRSSLSWDSDWKFENWQRLGRRHLSEESYSRAKTDTGFWSSEVTVSRPTLTWSGAPALAGVLRVSRSRVRHCRKVQNTYVGRGWVVVQFRRWKWRLPSSILGVCWTC